MATAYSEIYKLFMSMIEDYDLYELSQYDRSLVLYDLMRTACSQFTTCRMNLFDRDDELEQFAEDIGDREMDIICQGMKVAWMSPKLLQSDLFNTFLNTKDFYLSSPHQQLSRNRDTYETLDKKFRQALIEYSYLGDGA